jgi:hypothetical protein
MLALVGVLTVLLLAGTVAVVGTIIGRHGGAGPAPAATAPGRVVLDQPAGTHVTGASWNDGRLAVTLQGGGPDRVVVLDGAGHTMLEMRLAQ